MRSLKIISMLAVCAICLLGSVTFADLKPGDRSSDVKKLQTRLIKLKYIPKDTTLSKNYGELTEAGVAAFQERNGLEVTGILDSKTEKAIYGKNAKKAKTTVTPDTIKKNNDAQKDAADAASGSDTAKPQEQAAPQQQEQPLTFEQVLSIWAAQSQSVSDGQPQQAAAPAYGNSGTEMMIQLGMQLLGVRYKNGGLEPETGFDCSGYISYLLKQVGLKSPGSSRAMFEYEGWALVSDPNALQRGDILFFHTEGRSVEVGHSGIYLGNNEFLHAEPSNGVCITKLFDYNSKGEKSYYNRNYLGARRIP